MPQHRSDHHHRLRTANNSNSTLPPSTVGPLSSCGVYWTKGSDVCRAVEDIQETDSFLRYIDETPSLGSISFSSSSSLSRTASTEKQSTTDNRHMMMSSSSMRNDALVKRLAEYEARGWITRADFHHYRELMQKKGKSEYYRKQIAKDLDVIASHHRKSKSTGSVTSSSVSGPASPTKSLANSESPELLSRHSLLRKSGSGSRSAKPHVSWDEHTLGNSDASASEFAAILEDNKENGDSSFLTTKQNVMILEPIDLWQGPGRLTQTQLQELFVEMCFYARLGFVQPPCCLRCTYRDALRNKQKVGPDLSCKRWVIWRKNAESMLHPTGLDGNILILQCHAARRLLVGELVEGRQWDAARKQVVRSGAV